MNSAEDTIAAIATPLGEGGLGVIRISGPKAISVASKIFRKKSSSQAKTSSFPAVTGVPFLSIEREGPSPDCSGDGESMDPLPETAGDDVRTAITHTCLVGTIGTDRAVDQAVLTIFRAPNSYTGEDVIEISAHGSPSLLQKILKLCTSHGARLAGPGEFTARAFLNGKMDLTQAEAVAELIRAKTDKSQAAALAQLQGSLANKIRDLRGKLLPLLAQIEVGLDHSDENHEYLLRDELIKICENVQSQMNVILASRSTGKVLREGFRIALLGRPNVGKSSLMNALLKEERAIVTPIPGTTRDTLEETLSVNGIPVILTDTAGLRTDPQDPVEKIGIDRTHETLVRADMVIGLFDGSEVFTSDDAKVMQEASGRPHLWVINKSDLPAKFSSKDLHARNGSAEAIPLSAKTGHGMESLLEAIQRQALGEKAGASEAQWLLNARHAAALEKASQSLTQAVTSARSQMPEECVALDLKTTLDHLGEIIGETTTEDLLGEVFSRFCIGK